MKGYWKAILVLGLCGALLALSHIRRVRWDLTDDRHYSLSEATKTLLKQTDAPIEVTLLLDGDLNAGFTRLKKATEELLEEMSVYSDLRTSKDLAVSKDSLGLRPIVIHEREQNGKTAQTTIYPYALISYKGRGAVVTLLKNTRGLSGEENLNNSIEQLEYAFAEALHRLQQTELPRIAIIEGHGEPNDTSGTWSRRSVSISMSIEEPSSYPNKASTCIFWTVIRRSSLRIRRRPSAILSALSSTSISCEEARFFG